jgi:hypothetical protein
MFVVRVVTIFRKSLQAWRILGFWVGVEFLCIWGTETVAAH